VKVRDVTIRDSKKTAPTVNGMFFVWADGRICEDIEFVRCKAIDVGSTGFNLNGQRSPRVTRNIRFEDCLALRCGNEGSGKQWAVGFDFHEGADLYDLYVNNCRAEDCWESGFYFEPNFRNPSDPNTALPVQENSVVKNCVAVNNGWRNTLSTRFYLTGYYLSAGVTLSNCISINNRKNGFWIWQGGEDVTMRSCIDSGSDYSYQVRTGNSIRLENCFSKNARTYALYMWGSDGATVRNLQIANPKSTTGCIAMGLREDHPEQWWPVKNCVVELKVTGTDVSRLFRYYNGEGNRITVNGASIVPVPLLPLPTPPTTVPTTTVPTTTATTAVPTTSHTPETREVAAIPGSILAADYDTGGEGVAYHDTTPGNTGGYYRNDDVDIELCSLLGDPVVAYTRPGEWLGYTVNVTRSGIYEASFRVSSQASSSLSVMVDGVNFGSMTVPNTGSWQTYASVSRLIWLGSGTHTIRVETQGYHNLHLIQVYPPGQAPVVTTRPTTIPTTATSTTAATTTTTTIVPTATATTGTPIVTATPTATATITPTATPVPGVPLPGTVQAENWTAVGPSPSSMLRISPTGVQGQAISAKAEMAWAEYAVDVAGSGVAEAVFRIRPVAPNGGSNGTARLFVDGTAWAQLTAQGDATAFVNQSRLIYLQKGEHTLRLELAKGLAVDYISVGTAVAGRAVVITPLGTATPTPEPSEEISPTPEPVVPTLNATAAPPDNSTALSLNATAVPSVSVNRSADELAH
jgi:hypothetical protein